MTSFKDWTPRGVIPAVLLPFHADFSIDERSRRKRSLPRASTANHQLR